MIKIAVLDDYQNVFEQIININNTLNEIQNDEPPYVLAANRIISYL